MTSPVRNPADLTFRRYHIPRAVLRGRGGADRQVEPKEMARTFDNGIGMVAVVSAADTGDAVKYWCCVR